MSSGCASDAIRRKTQSRSLQKPIARLAMSTARKIRIWVRVAASADAVNVHALVIVSESQVGIAGQKMSRSRTIRRPEQALQKAVVQHLRIRGVPGLVFFHVPNGGHRKPI